MMEITSLALTAGAFLAGFAIWLPADLWFFLAQRQSHASHSHHSKPSRRLDASPVCSGAAVRRMPLLPSMGLCGSHCVLALFLLA
jgi:hypothetical protein